MPVLWKIIYKGRLTIADKAELVHFRGWRFRAHSRRTSRIFCIDELSPGLQNSLGVGRRIDTSHARPPPSDFQVCDHDETSSAWGGDECIVLGKTV